MTLINDKELKPCTSALCIVPTRVLLEQWEGALKEFYNGPIGIIGDNQNTVHNFTLATFESAYRKMSWLGSQVRAMMARAILVLPAPVGRQTIPVRFACSQFRTATSW